MILRLWERRINEHEVQGCRATECPGEGWYELTVDPQRALRESLVAPLQGKEAARAAILSALPDILLAVADGAHLVAELRKVLDKEASA